MNFIKKQRELWISKANGYYPEWEQCIEQVMEPICEAKFSNNSFGFRPNRSVEHAISRTYRMLQMSNLHYVIEFDIKGFFDNVDHSKLIKQIWALGIRDKELIYVVDSHNSQKALKDKGEKLANQPN